MRFSDSLRSCFVVMAVLSGFIHCWRQTVLPQELGGPFHLHRLYIYFLYCEVLRQSEVMFCCNGCTLWVYPLLEADSVPTGTHGTLSLT